MISTMLTHLQQQAARLSHVEQNQQTTPHVINNHIHNSLHNILQDEVSSQQRRTGQRVPRTEAVINTNGNKGRHNNETSVIEIEDTGNSHGNGSGNNGNNRNRRRGRNSPYTYPSDNGSIQDDPYENKRRG
ncbi:hypothetical protein P8452_57670 [Trifolium repens]|jgi:hypothetical protein|nr:hypothetical protein P8452_57670 [Trifolium repens]